MRLDQKNEFGEELYECDRCQIMGAKDSVIIEECDRHYCMSCWCEKERNRFRKDRKSLVEF
jgi:hypothetical protein